MSKEVTRDLFNYHISVLRREVMICTRKSHLPRVTHKSHVSCMTGVHHSSNLSVVRVWSRHSTVSLLSGIPEAVVPMTQ